MHYTVEGTKGHGCRISGEGYSLDVRVCGDAGKPAQLEVEDEEGISTITPYKHEGAHGLTIETHDGRRIDIRRAIMTEPTGRHHRLVIETPDQARATPYNLKQHAA